jgi:hypothetical protein
MVWPLQLVIVLVFSEVLDINLHEAWSYRQEVSDAVSLTLISLAKFFTTALPLLVIEGLNSRSARYL